MPRIIGYFLNSLITDKNKTCEKCISDIFFRCSRTCEDLTFNVTKKKNKKKQKKKQYGTKMLHIVCHILPEISQMRDKYDRIFHTFEEYVCVKFKVHSNPNVND